MLLIFGEIILRIKFNEKEIYGIKNRNEKI